MREGIKMKDQFGMKMGKKIIVPNDNIPLDGVFTVEHYREGKIINQFSFHNGITNVGKNYILNCGFASGTQSLIAQWRMGLVDSDEWSAFNASDIMSNHPGWKEFTGYSQSARAMWGPATSVAQILTNPTLCVFDITTTGSVFGAFIVNDSVKGGTGGILWTTGSFPNPTSVTAGTDELRLSYNLAA